MTSNSHSSYSSTTCSILCLKSLLNILHSNSMFKDVYREVGLLEVLVTCLHRYAAILKEAFPDVSDEKPGIYFRCFDVNR